MPAKKIYRKKPAAKKGGKKRVYKKKSSSKNLADFGQLSVNRTYTSPNPVPPGQNGPIVANVMYNIMNTALDQFDRAKQAAQAFQFYRIKNITLKIRPQFDTFAFNTAGTTPTGYGKPKLYYMIDRLGALPTNVSLEALKQMGARPRELDEKPLSISFAPGVLTLDAIGAGGSQAAQKKISPWLTTSANTTSPLAWVANSVDHLGVYWYVESASYGGTGGMPYSVDVEVQFQFKKPLWSAQSATEAVGLVPAVLDASPDGIEGGSDGITIPVYPH